jgi:hypothetical protein
MKDIMLDLETMDSVRSASVVSIGAIQCNLITGEMGKTYYRVVELKGQMEDGATISTDTLYWWLQQSQGARDGIVIEGRILLTDMCTSFSKWLNSLSNSTNTGTISPKYLRLWGNGASFDNAIIRHVFERCKVPMPIDFWNDRDMRTIVGFYPRQLQDTYRRNNIRTGVYHNALDDCKYQIKYCSHILKELGVTELY